MNIILFSYVNDYTIHVDCAGRFIYGPGFEAGLLRYVTLVGWWDGDTEEEKIEARASEYVDEDEEDDE